MGRQRKESQRETEREETAQEERRKGGRKMKRAKKRKVREGCERRDKLRWREWKTIQKKLGGAGLLSFFQRLSEKCKRPEPSTQ